MFSTRASNVSQTLQEIRNVLTSHLEAPSSATQHKMTLVLGSDGLANNQLVSALTQRNPEKTAALCARLAPLPTGKNHWLCECPSLLPAEGLSNAAHVAASYSVEIAVKRAASIGGVVVVIPSSDLMSDEGYERFSTLMVRLGELIQGDWVIEQGLQVVVLSDSENIAEDQLREVYGRRLKTLLNSTRYTKEFAQLFRADNILNDTNWGVLKLLELLSQRVEAVSVVSTKNKDSLQSVLAKIESLAICTPPVFSFKNYHDIRFEFEDQLMKSMQDYISLMREQTAAGRVLTEDEKHGMCVMAEFFTNLPVCAFGKTQEFLSRWGASQKSQCSLSLFSRVTYLVE